MTHSTAEVIDFTSHYNRRQQERAQAPVEVPVLSWMPVWVMVPVVPVVYCPQLPTE